jgi:hypothetical protein
VARRLLDRKALSEELMTLSIFWITIPVLECQSSTRGMPQRSLTTQQEQQSKYNFLAHFVVCYPREVWKVPHYGLVVRRTLFSAEQA